MPVWDKTQRKDETLSSGDFQWDEQADEYRCPQGHPLRSQWRAFQNPRTHVTKAGTIIYRSSHSDCATCPMKARCCPNTPIRKIARSVHESARDVARDIAKTERLSAIAQRSQEGRNALRTSQADLEARSTAATGTERRKRRVSVGGDGQNLRRMAKWLIPTAPQPASYPHKRKSGADSLHLAGVTESSPLTRSPRRKHFR